MLPLTGDIKEGVTYIRRDGSECTMKDRGTALLMSDDHWFYGPVGDPGQFKVRHEDELHAMDIVGIKE